MIPPATHPLRPARVLLGIIAVLWIAGCGARDKAVEELDIREAVYRYQFATDLHTGDEGPHLAILVDGHDTDPDDAFMSRFVNYKPTVRKASECENFAGQGMRNKKTGRRSIVLATGTIIWVSSRRVQVAGGYDQGVSAARDTFYVTRAFGQWRVTKRVRQPIS